MWSAGFLCTALKRDKLLQLVKKENDQIKLSGSKIKLHNEYEHLNWSVPNKSVFLIWHVRSLNIHLNCFYKANYALGSIPSVLKEKQWYWFLMLVSLNPKPVFYSLQPRANTVQRIWSRQQETAPSPSE